MGTGVWVGQGGKVAPRTMPEGVAVANGFGRGEATGVSWSAIGVSVEFVDAPRRLKAKAAMAATHSIPMQASTTTAPMTSGSRLLPPGAGAGAEGGFMLTLPVRVS